MKKIVIMLVVLLFIISTCSSAYARSWSNHHHNDNNNNNNNNNNNSLNQTVASFTATPTSGNAPLSVTFTDTSTGSPTYWSWNFGDGGTSASQNPTHTYTQAGTYTVTLTATNSAGKTDTKSSYISVTNPVSSPVTSFSASPTSGNTPLTVTFTDASTRSPTYWSWNFGDGGTSAAQNPTHTYTQAGTYTVSLTATNSAGSNTATKSGYINVANPVSSPVASFTTASTTSGNVLLSVTFLDTSTGSPTSWSWNFGDGGTSAEQNPTHTYNQAGTYTVTLTATNSAGSDTTTKSITGANTVSIPVASFSAAPTSGNTPLTVTFTDTSAGFPTYWSWNFGDGGTSAAQNPTHTYTQTGTYTITLTATNSAGSNTATKSSSISVTNPVSSPVASFTAAPTSGNTPLTVTFTDTSIGSPTSWSWNFGDGGTSTSQNTTHTYTQSGKYTPSLTVSNAYGSNTFVSSTQIAVTSAPDPTIEADFSSNVTSGKVPLKVQFNDLSTGYPTIWNWNFGDGAIISGKNSSIKNPTHTYSAVGVYTVTLKVSSATSFGSITKKNYITVGNGLQAAFTTNPSQGTAPLTVQFNDTSIGTPTEWLWDFGDGNSSTLNKPVHIYTQTGNYTVKLTVSNNVDSNTTVISSAVNVSSVNIPVADFNSNVTSGKVPLNVQFNDLSTGNPTAWNWDFGDEASSTTKDPMHIYLAAGVYNVTLRVSNSAGWGNITKKDYITVGNGLQAAFTTNPSQGVAPLTVQFNDTSIGTPTEWLWDFGDGNTSTLYNPVHIYTQAGSYTVKLTVTNDTDSNTVTKSDFIVVSTPTAPVAAFTTSPISGYAPLTVTFTDTSTGSPSSWSWNFGDGSPLNITQSPIHVFTKKGNFNVILIVSNNNRTSSKSVQITVETMPKTTFWNLLPHEQNHQRPYSMIVYNIPNFFGFKQNKGHYFYVSDFFSNRYSSWNTYRNSNVPFAFDIPANSINISSLYVGASHQKPNQEYVEILNKSLFGSLLSFLLPFFRLTQ